RSPCSTTCSSPRNLSRNLSRTAVRRLSESGTCLTSSLQRGQARISSSSASIAIGAKCIKWLLCHPEPRKRRRIPASSQGILPLRYAQGRDETRMKVLHLAAGNRWTGAAAPAFAEVAALRDAGVDAHYAYVGGYKLQAKIGHFDFAHPIIAKAQNPFSFTRTVGAIDRLIDRHGFDILHAHLTYDHWLARFAARGWPARIVRTFHSARVIR